MDDDKECVSQVLQGNKQAYGYLIDKYRDKVHAIMIRMLNQSQDAQDLTQECFIKAYNSLHSFDSERKFSSWLYRIAVNLCITNQQTKQRQPYLYGDLELVSLPDTPSPECMYLKKEFATELHFLIDRLPESYKIVLLLRYVDDLTYQEMSQVLDIPVNLVQVRLYRARQKLREYFSKTKEGGELHEVR